MMNRFSLCFLLVFATSVLATNAAVTYITMDDDSTVTIYTGTSGGQCTVTPLGGGLGTDVHCTDGNGNAARANTVTGCMETEGRGFCAKGAWGTSLHASNQLNCENGDSYNLSTGNDNGSCARGAGDSMTCDDNGDPQNSASANCDSGCQSSTGSGCCCKAATTGCGGGTDCTGK